MRAGPSPDARQRGRPRPPARPARGRGSRLGSASSSATRPALRTPPRVGCSSARPRGAAASTCRRRCGPSARPARRPRGAARRRAGSPGRERSSCQTPVERRSGPAVAGAPRALRSRRLRRRLSSDCSVRRAGPRARSAARARLTPGTGAEAEPSQQPRAGRHERRAPRRPPRPGTRPARRRRRRAPSAHRDHPVGRRPGSARAGARPARSSCRSPRCSGAAADQLVAGDRVELRGRLVEHHQLRPPGERRAERDALQLTAGQLVGRALEQLRDPERQRDLLDRPGDRGRRLAAVLEPERELGAGRSSSRPASRGPGTGSRRRARARPARARGCRCPRRSRRPAKVPPWKCGTSPLAARSSVDLPEPDAPATTTSCPAPISSVTSRSAGRRRAGVGVGDAGRTRARSPLDPPAVGERQPARTRRSRPPTAAHRRPGRRVQGRVRGERRQAADAGSRPPARRAPPRPRRTRGRGASTARRTSAPRPARGARSRAPRARRRRRARGRARRCEAARISVARDGGRPAGSAGRRRAGASRGPGPAPCASPASRSAPSETRTGGTAPAPRRGRPRPCTARRTSTRDRPQAENRAVDGRLERHVGLTEDRQVAEPRRSRSARLRRRAR